jgi:hypothetical protein
VKKNLVDQEDYYIDEFGNWVFTQAYHLKKGYCCGHGCKHCPYEYCAVPDSKRSEMVNKKNNTE